MDINNTFNILNLLISASKGQNTTFTKVSKKWQLCVALAGGGWEIKNWEQIPGPEDQADDTMVTWRKDGKRDIQVRLSFTDQCLWLEYMERKARGNNNDDNIQR